MNDDNKEFKKSQLKLNKLWEKKWTKRFEETQGRKIMKLGQNQPGKPR